MQIFQDILDSQIKELLSFPTFGTRLIKTRFDELGITLSDKQLAEIETKLSNLEDDSITINIDDSQLIAADFNLEDLDKNFQIDLRDSDQELEQFFNQVIEGLSDLTPAIITELSELILEEFKRDTSSMLEERRKYKIRFEANVIEVWGKSLNLLELLLALTLEAGEDFNHEFRTEDVEEQDFVFEVLTRLHARACLVASEILVLLQSGHADGAHARWRSLHEIAVVGSFVRQFGNEIAEQYLLHDTIESYKAARQYQQDYSALGYESIPDEEFNEIKRTYHDLITRFGRDYKETYGWAASILGKKSPTFRDIEEKVKLDHLRPYYKLASHNVHANPKGVFFKLGLYPDQDILLAGPSNTGLADPGHGTTISLNQITVALLLTRPNIDRLVVCDTLIKLSKEIGKEFLKAQQSLENGQNT